jgi:hypothetical protein
LNPTPDNPTQLFCDDSDYLLFFAPVEVVIELQATRGALGSAKTWGDVRRSISSKRFDELAGDMLPIDTEPNDEDAFEPPDNWPLMRMSQMLDWLPGAVVKRYGEEFNSMAGSGINFKQDQKDAIVKALEADGIVVRFDGPALYPLFSDDS